MQPLGRQPALADRPDQRVAQVHEGVLVLQAAADADGVGAGRDGPHGAGRDAVGAGDGAHLDAVGDDQPVEAQLLAEQPGEDALRHGGRQLGVVRVEQDVRGHDALHAGRDGRPERQQVLAELVGGQVDPGQPEVRVAGRVAVAGEVLGAGRDAGGLQAADVRGGVPGRQVAVAAEGADADHRVVRVGVDVRVGRVVQVHADGGQVEPDRAGDPLGEVGVVDLAERQVARVGGPAGHFEAGDVAALLVGGDQQVAVERVHLRGQRGDLLRGADVAAEQGDAAEFAVAQSAAQPLGCGQTGEAGLQDRSGVAQE